MICRQCGTEIADKAIVCYRCGTATTEPARKPAAIRPRRRGVVPIIGLILLVISASLFVESARIGPASDTGSNLMLAAEGILAVAVIFMGAGFLYSRR